MCAGRRLDLYSSWTETPEDWIPSGTSTSNLGWVGGLSDRLYTVHCRGLQGSNDGNTNFRRLGFAREGEVTHHPSTPPLGPSRPFGTGPASFVPFFPGRHLNVVLDTGGRIGPAGGRVLQEIGIVLGPGEPETTYGGPDGLGRAVSRGDSGPQSGLGRATGVPTGDGKATTRRRAPVPVPTTANVGSPSPPV